MRSPQSERIVRLPADEVIKEKYEAYIRAVGDAAFSFNQLHEALGRLFAVVVNGEERETTQAVWYSLSSDRGQRLMLRAAVKASSPSRWPATPKVGAEVLWLLDKADVVAKMRNDAVHLPASLMVGSEQDGGAYMGALFINGHPGALKARGADLLADFNACVEHTDILTRYARDIEAAIVSAARYGWPERPGLAERPKKTTS